MDRPITSTKSMNRAKDENNKVINRQHFKNSYYKYGQEFKEKYKHKYQATWCLKVNHTKSERRNSG